MNKSIEIQVITKDDFQFIDEKHEVDYSEEVMLNLFDAIFEAISLNVATNNDEFMTDVLQNMTMKIPENVKSLEKDLGLRIIIKVGVSKSELSIPPTAVSVSPHPHNKTR